MATRTTLNVSLTPELDAFVQETVKSGQYQSASEVVRDALRRLQEAFEDRRRYIEKLNADVAVGMAQLERGETVDGEAVMREIWEKIQRFKAAHP